MNDYTEFLEDGLFLCQCDGTEKPTWRKAIMQMDKLIRELFPGYCITERKSYP